MFSVVCSRACSARVTFCGSFIYVTVTMLPEVASLYVVWMIQLAVTAAGLPGLNLEGPSAAAH